MISPYGLIVGVAFATGWMLFEHVLKKTPSKTHNPPLKTAQETHPHLVNEDSTWLLGSLLIALGCIIGARLYHLATDWPAYAHLAPAAALRAALALSNGGLGWYGAIIGSVIAAFFWKHLTKLPWSMSIMIDAAALTLPFMQAIGRWGNFVNQELFGPPTSLPWGIYIAPPMRPPFFASATHFHPLFAYESLANLGIGLALWATWRWARPYAAQIPFLQLGNGWYSAMYALSYGLLRFTLDLGRWDLSRWQLSGLALTSSQWFSLLLIMMGLLNFAWKMRQFIRQSAVENADQNAVQSAE